MQDRTAKQKKVICFSGVDGSGKSTHARCLFNELEAAGVKCRYKWLRYPHFLALLPLFFYQIRNSKVRFGSASTQDPKPIRIQVKTNRIIATAWAFILLVDSLFSMTRNVYLPALLSYTLILDRFVVDTLLDTALNLRREELVFSMTGRLFLRLVPKNSLILIFDVEERLAASRKHSLDEENFTRKSALYKRLSQLYHWNIISTEAPFREVHDRVLKFVNQQI